MRKTLEERFWAKVEKRGANDCWPWLGGKSAEGYGLMRVKGATHGAHRISYALNSGEAIPPSLYVCHSCDNRICVNPHHLWLGTHSQNNADKVAKGRQSKGFLGRRPQPKLSHAQVQSVRALNGQATVRHVASIYGVSRSQVHRIWSGQNWKHIPQEATI
jgi:hypothetical protein